MILIGYIYDSDIGSFEDVRSVALLSLFILLSILKPAKIAERYYYLSFYRIRFNFRNIRDYVLPDT